MVISGKKKFNERFAVVSFLGNNCFFTPANNTLFLEPPQNYSEIVR